MQFAPAAEIGPLLPGTMPLFVALIGWLVFGERLAGVRVLGFALILIGVVCIGGYGLLLAGNGAWRGHLLLLTGACLWGIYTHAYRRSGLSALQAAALIGFWSFLILLPFGVPPLVHAFGKGSCRADHSAGASSGSSVRRRRHRALRHRHRPPRRLARRGRLAPVHRARGPDRHSGSRTKSRVPPPWIGIILATLGVVLASGILKPGRIQPS